MKKYLLAISLIAAAVVACRKEEGGIVSGAEASVTAAAWSGYSWQEGDAIGIYTTDGVLNAKASISAGTSSSEGTFTGNFGDPSLIEGAYWPYSANAGNNVDMIKFTVPDDVEQAGEETALYAFATGAAGNDGMVEFSQRLATLEVTFSNVSGSALEGTRIQDLTVDTDGAAFLTGVFNVSVSDNMAPIVSTVASIDGVTMTFGNAEVTDLLKGYAAVAPFTVSGTKTFRLKVTAGGRTFNATVPCSSGVEAGGTYSIEFDASQFLPDIELVWANADFAGRAFQNQFPAIDNAGNVYVGTCGSDNITKLSHDGDILWSKAIGFGSGDALSPSCEPDGSRVYAAGPVNATNAHIGAFSPDGTGEWTFSGDRFWGTGPNLAALTIAVGQKNIYAGNRGNIGTVLSIDKATGERVAYVARDNSGTNGPSGGLNSGPAISVSGAVGWVSDGVLWGMPQDRLDNPSLSGDNGKFDVYGIATPWISNASRTLGGPICTEYNGEDYIVAYFPKTDGTLSVYAVKASDAVSSSAKADITPAWIHDIDSRQDQGALAVGPQGEIIVPLKNTSGDGGLYAITADGKDIAWKFEIGTDVGGAAAIDDAGNIHFLSDAPAKYWIVRPDYARKTCEEIASVDLLELARSSALVAGSIDDCTQSKSWTSVMIGYDGKMYVTINAGPDDNKYARGIVMCLQYNGCKGPGNTPWPMRAADCSHTGVQKSVK